MLFETSWDYPLYEDSSCPFSPNRLFRFKELIISFNLEYNIDNLTNLVLLSYLVDGRGNLQSMREGGGFFKPFLRKYGYSPLALPGVSKTSFIPRKLSLYHGEKINGTAQ
jgi:hypothetical protein